MKGWIALSALLCTVALMAVAAVPASARVPGGQGLTSFGFTDCGEPLGVVEIFGPPGEPSPDRLPDQHGGGRPARRRDALRIQLCWRRGSLLEELRQEERPDHVQLHGDGRTGGCLHPDGRGRSSRLIAVPNGRTISEPLGVSEHVVDARGVGGHCSSRAMRASRAGSRRRRVRAHRSAARCRPCARSERSSRACSNRRASGIVTRPPSCVTLDPCSALHGQAPTLGALGNAGCSAMRSGAEDGVSG